MGKALLLILFLKTDYNGVMVDYKATFPSMEECNKAVAAAKFTSPASENETTLGFVCVPDQPLTHLRFPQ